MSQSSSSLFNDLIHSDEQQLSTDSSHTVKTNTPSVPINSAHLYPRLAGSNWTSYLSQFSVILGRSGTVLNNDPNQDQRRPRKLKLVDIDLGNSKAISRRHCEIRYSARRDRWELYVYGRNGVKINHVIKRPGDKPSILKSSDLIEIDGTSFVFVLPNNDNYLKPGMDPDQLSRVLQNNDQQQNEETESEINTPKDEDNTLNHELELAVVKVLERYNSLNTEEILNYLEPEIDKENLLHLLVLNPRFHLVPNSSKESDSAKWMLIPQTITKDLDTAPVKIVNDNNEVFHQKNKENLLDTSTSLNKVTFIQTQSEAEKMNNSQSRSTSSFPKLFSDDWSIFTPNTPETTVVGNAIPEPRLEAETVTIQEERDDHSQCTLSSLCLSSSVSQISQSPLSFPRSMSIESIYLIWTSSTRSIEENERPNKKLRKMNNSDENIAINDSISTEKSENNENKKIEENIYKEVHSKILIE